jgi:hypothetical protein
LIPLSMSQSRIVPEVVPLTSDLPLWANITGPEPEESSPALARFLTTGRWVRRSYRSKPPQASDTAKWPLQAVVIVDRIAFGDSVVDSLWQYISAALARRK